MHTQTAFVVTLCYSIEVVFNAQSTLRLSQRLRCTDLECKWGPHITHIHKKSANKCKFCFVSMWPLGVWSLRGRELHLLRNRLTAARAKIASNDLHLRMITHWATDFTADLAFYHWLAVSDSTWTARLPFDWLLRQATWQLTSSTNVCYISLRAPLFGFCSLVRQARSTSNDKRAKSEEELNPTENIGEEIPSIDWLLIWWMNDRPYSSKCCRNKNCVVKFAVANGKRAETAKEPFFSNIKEKIRNWTPHLSWYA